VINSRKFLLQVQDDLQRRTHDLQVFLSELKKTYDEIDFKGLLDEVRKNASSGL
jgi:hypothetical protein